VFLKLAKSWASAIPPGPPELRSSEGGPHLDAPRDPRLDAPRTSHLPPH
jgi:hypothetical protein